MGVNRTVYPPRVLLRPLDATVKRLTPGALACTTTRRADFGVTTTGSSTGVPTVTVTGARSSPASPVTRALPAAVTGRIPDTAVRAFLVAGTSNRTCQAPATGGRNRVVVTPADEVLVVDCATQRVVPARRNCTTTVRTAFGVTDTTVASSPPTRIVTARTGQPASRVTTGRAAVWAAAADCCHPVVPVGCVMGSGHSANAVTASSAAARWPRDRAGRVDGTPDTTHPP